MNNFARAHDSYLEPPDDDPVCEDCGETLVRNDFSDGWFCNNKFCPLKFSGVEKEMAEALVEFMLDSEYYRQRYSNMKREIESLKEQIEELKWKIQENNK